MCWQGNNQDSGGEGTPVLGRTVTQTWEEKAPWESDRLPGRCCLRLKGSCVTEGQHFLRVALRNGTRIIEQRVDGANSVFF